MNEKGFPISNLLFIYNIYFLGEILSKIEAKGELSDDESKQLSLLWDNLTKKQKLGIYKVVTLLKSSSSGKG